MMGRGVACIAIAIVMALSAEASAAGDQEPPWSPYDAQYGGSTWQPAAADRWGAGQTPVVYRTGGATRAPPARQQASSDYLRIAANDAPTRAEAARARREGRGFFDDVTLSLGVGAHDVGVFGSKKESGKNVNVEVRFGDIGDWFDGWLLSPRPHVGVHINTVGDTSQLYAGVTWMFDFGWDLFGGGSLGLALHNGETSTNELDRKELGLPVLFRESAEFGVRISNRHSLSLMLDHISNAKIAENNEGIDTFVIRYSVDM